MNASATSAVRLANDVHVRFVRATTYIGAWLLVLLGIWMCGRRVFGGIQRPLPFYGFCVLALLVVCLASLVRIGWFWAIPANVAYRNWKWIGFAVPAIGVLTLVASVSLPSSPTAGLALCWTVVVVAELAWAIILFQSHGKQHFLGEVSRRCFKPAAAVDRQRQIAHNDTDAMAEDGNEELSFEEGLSQSLTRRTLTDGSEEITGLLRCEFVPQQRTENLHVGFCPPLDDVPEISFSQVSGAPARIKVGDTQTIGARFELKLMSSHPEESEVVIHFIANRSSRKTSAGVNS